MEAYKSKSPMRGKSTSKSPLRKSKSPIRPQVRISKSPMRSYESKSPIRPTKSPIRDGSKSPKPKNAAMMSL